LHEHPFDPSALLRQVAALARHRATARGLGFTLELHPRLPAPVFGDVERHRQVVLKLHDDAVRSTPAGSGTLAAMLVAEDAAGWRLEVSVTHTGIGLPAEDRARLCPASAPLRQTEGIE
jgi:signal transduction histidine kinase